MSECPLCLPDCTVRVKGDGRRDGAHPGWGQVGSGFGFPVLEGPGSGQASPPLRTGPPGVNSCRSSWLDSFPVAPVTLGHLCEATQSPS